MSAWVRVPGNVWALGLTSFVTDISSEMVVSSLPAYLVLSLGFSPLAFGTIDGLYYGASGVTGLLGGWLADRTRRYKEVAAVGYALSALCKVMLLIASTPLAVASVIGLDRLGKGVRTAPRDALIGLSVDRTSLGRAFGIHRALDTAGAALGPFVAFAVLYFAGRAFDAVFLVSFALAIVGLASVFLLVRNPDAGDSPSEPRTAGGAALRTLARTKPFTRLWLAAVVLSLTTISDGFLYLVLQRALNVDAAMVPLMFAGTSLCYFIAAVPLGRAADLFGRRTIFLFGYAVLFCAYLVTLLALPSIWQLVAVLLLLGAYYGATDGVLAAFASEILPRNIRGTGLAALTTGVTLGRFVASLAFGYLWTMQSPAVALQSFAGALVVSLTVAALTLRRTPREVHP
jgi:MFS family permease